MKRAVHLKKNAFYNTYCLEMSFGLCVCVLTLLTHLTFRHIYNALDKQKEKPR